MIGQRIKQLRTQRGLTLSELADRADVAKSYISSIERDLQSNPTIQFLEKVASVLNVSVESIIHPESNEQELIDQEWLSITRDAISSGISKDRFREFLEFNKWRDQKKDE